MPKVISPPADSRDPPVAPQCRNWFKLCFKTTDCQMERNASFILLILTKTLQGISLVSQLTVLLLLLSRKKNVKNK